MTQVSDATLKAALENGDQPDAADWIDFVDSKVNVAALASVTSGEGADLVWGAYQVVRLQDYGSHKASGVFGDGTDDAPAIQAAINAHPKGAKLVVPRDSAAHIVYPSRIDFDTTEIAASYVLGGYGRDSKLYLDGYDNPISGSTPQITDNNFAINVGDDGTGAFNAFTTYPAFPTHWRLTVQDLAIYGDDSDYPCFLWFNGAPVRVERCWFNSMHVGISGNSYTDHNTFIGNRWVSAKDATSTFYWQRTTGDGLLMENNSSYPSNQGYMARIFWCAGGNILSPIQGRYLIQQSHGITISGGHWESSADGPFITVQDSSARIVGNYLWSRDATYSPIHIDDLTSGTFEAASIVEITGNRFIVNQASATTAEAQPNIYLDPQLSTRVTLRGNAAGWFMGGGFAHRNRGVTVGSSVAALQTALDALGGYVSSDVRIAAINAGWKVLPTAGAFHSSWNVTTPTFTLATTDGYAGNLTEATYYYRFAVRTAVGTTDAATEDSVAVSAEDEAAGKAIAFAIDPNAIEGTLLCWRGTASATYDRYAEVPFAAGYIYGLYDAGGNIGAIPWETTGIPDLPSANGAIAGIAGSRIIGWAAATPNGGYVGTLAGDIVINEAASLASPKFWVRTDAGAAGVWQAQGFGRGATGSRPTLTNQDGGFPYWDTSLGKLIIWSGAAWVNVDGSGL